MTAISTKRPPLREMISPTRCFVRGETEFRSAIDVPRSQIRSGLFSGVHGLIRGDRRNNHVGAAASAAENSTRSVPVSRARAWIFSPTPGVCM